MEFPRQCDFRVVLGGQTLHQSVGAGAMLEITRPGAYRVEVALPGIFAPRPWLYSNPIYVTADVTGA